MSLLIPGTKRVKAFVLMLAVALAASMSLLAVPSASATEGVTVTPGEPECHLMFRTVTNSTNQWLYLSGYETRNGLRTDYPGYRMIAPGESLVANTDGNHYFSHSLGVKTGLLVSRPGTAPTIEWTDWGATEYVLPADCPPMVASAKVTKRTKAVTKKPRPIIWFKTYAYYTDFGYRVGKSKRIRWVSKWTHDGLQATYGPRLKPGQRVKVKFYSRNIDDYHRKTEPVYLGKKRFKRVR